MQAAPCRTLARRALARMLAGLALLPSTAAAQTRTTPAPRPVRPAITRVLQFKSAPFPYRGPGDDGKTPFYNVIEGATRRYGRLIANGEILWENVVFADAGVLVHVPAGFDPRQPVRLVVFFHGHGSAIDRVAAEMEIARQVTQADINAVLVAPQFARDAPDSSAGKFWRPGAFARFLEEAALQVSDAAAASRAERPVITAALRRAPVILVAFSGGYKPAAFVLDRGGATPRVGGVILLDALYDEEDRYARWFAATRGRSFLVSLYTESTATRQAILMERLRQRRIAVGTAVPAALRPGTAAFVDCGPISRHGRFVLDGPPHEPLRMLLAATRPPPPAPRKPAGKVPVAARKTRPAARPRPAAGKTVSKRAR